MATDQKTPTNPANDFGSPWLPGDPLPSGHAEERSSDSAWDLFNALVEGRHEEPFPDTAATSLRMELQATQEPAQQAQAVLGVAQVLVEARRGNRVCPRAAHWKAFYELLLAGQPTRPGLTPPIAGEAWSATPSLFKRMCLREQIEWAAAHGCLEQAHAFIVALPEDQWHHMGE